MDAALHSCLASLPSLLTSLLPNFLPPTKLILLATRSFDDTLTSAMMKIQLQNTGYYFRIRCTYLKSLNIQLKCIIMRPERVKGGTCALRWLNMDGLVACLSLNGVAICQLIARGQRVKRISFQQYLSTVLATARWGAAETVFC